MKKVLAVVASLLVVLGAGAALSVPYLERHAAAQLKEAIEHDGVASVDAVEVGLLDRSVELRNLRNKQVAGIAASKWSASGIAWPLADLLRGRLPLDGWRLGDPLRADSVEAHDVTLTDDSGNGWKFGHLLLKGVELERYDADLGTSPFRFAILGARALQALSIRRLEERDVSFRDLSGGGFAMDSIVLDDVERGRIGAIAVRNFQVAGVRPEKPEFSVADIKAEGLDFQRILGAMSDAGWYFGAPLGRLGLGKLDVSGFGGELLARYGITVGRVSSEFKQVSDKVVHGSSHIEGFVLAPPLRGLESLQLRLALTAMGLKDVRLGFDCSGVEDRAKGEIKIERCALTGRDLGEIDFAASLIDIDEPFWLAMDSGDYGLAQASKAALGGARLVLADRSLLDRSIKAYAATAGQPASRVRSELAQEVRRFQPAGVLITEDLNRLLDTVARFVEQGGTLTFEARPDPPFGLDRLGYLLSPGPDLVTMLGITAKLSK